MQRKNTKMPKLSQSSLIDSVRDLRGKDTPTSVHLFKSNLITFPEEKCITNEFSGFDNQNLGKDIN